MRLLAFNGVSFAALQLGAGVTREGQPGPEVQPLTLSRRGALPVHLGVDQGTKTIVAAFVVAPGVDAEQALLQAIGIWNPRDESERLLEGELNDGTAVQTYAALGAYRFLAVNQFELEFTQTDPTWWAPDPVPYGPVTWAYETATSLSVPNTGKAQTNLVVTLTPTANKASGEFQWRRQFTVTNNSDMPLRRHPLQVVLGETSTWSGPPVAGRIWLFLDGLPVAATFTAGTGLPGPVSAWFIVSELGPGQSLTYDVCWNGASAAPTLSGADLPAFDINSARGTASSGAVDRLYVAGTPWGAEQWTGGTVTLVAGTGAGQTRTVTSNQPNFLAVAPNWTTVPTSSSVYLVSQSNNAHWVYRVQQTEHSGANDRRGLWYLNRGQSRPSVAVFDVPGGWYRLLRFDNNDEKNQSRWVGIVPDTGGTADYFALLDADRTAQGWTKLQEEGQADGVGFSSPIPITGWTFDYQFKNPNGIGRAFFGARESGAEDWEPIVDNPGTYQTLTAQPQTAATFTADMRHLVATLEPANEEVIPVSFIRDQGSRSGGGSVTLYDDSKSWQPDQWVGATVRIVAGTGSGQARTVVSNTSVALTVATAWSTIPSDDSRYEVVNKVLVATLRAANAWRLAFSPTAIAVSALTAETPVYAQKRSFFLSQVATLAPPYQEIRLGLDGRRLFLGASEELRIDGHTRRALVYAAGTNVLIRDVTSAVRVTDVVTAAASYYAPEWLPVFAVPAGTTTATLILPNQVTDVTVALGATLLEGWYA